MWAGRASRNACSCCRRRRGNKKHQGFWTLNLNSIKWNTGLLREVFVRNSAVLCSENGLWGQICHRCLVWDGGVSQPILKLKVSQTWVLLWALWRRPLSLTCVWAHHAFLNIGSTCSIWAPSAGLHGRPWDDVRVPTSPHHVLWQTSHKLKLDHRGLLPVCPSGLFHPEMVLSVQMLFIHFGGETIQKVSHERGKKKWSPLF